MTIQQAIDKAIDYGWSIKKYGPMFSVFLGTLKETGEYRELAEMYVRQSALLDPSFWQALGKAMGWDGLMCKNCHFDAGADWGHQIDGCIDCIGRVPQEVATYHWHRLIDHLSEGKDVDSYFAGL